MGPENAFIAAQLSMLTKAIRDIGGGTEATPLRGYVTRFDRGESYFQEDGKGYLAVGSEINDPALYDTKAFPYEETMPHWEYEPVFGPGLAQPSTGYSPTLNWRWATCDDTNIAMGNTDSISFSSNGEDFTTLYLTEAESGGWTTANDKLKQVYDAVYHAGVLWVVASTHANSTARLLKLTTDLKGFTEIPNSTSLNRFKKTNGRVLCVGGSIAYDITNPEEPIRYTPGAFNDITYWSGKWWVATATGLKSGVDLAGALDVVTAGAHYLVNGSVDGLMASIGTSILLTTDGTNWNPATGPEGLSIGSTATLTCGELNGKLAIRSTSANSTTITSQQNVIIYDPKTNSWEELFTPDGMVVITAYAIPLWYRGEYWVFGTLGAWNNYMRTTDLRVWSGQEVDAIASTFYTDETLRKNLLATLRSGDKILRLHARNITYSLDGGVTYKTALGPQKSVGALTPWGLNVFEDNGEFFIFSFRGHWVSSDLENWTALPTTFLLDNTSSGGGRTITRLKPDMWVSHGAYNSSTNDTYFSTDRGRSWTVVTLKNVLGVYFDTTRNKYGAFVGNQVYVGSTIANLALVNSQTTTNMSSMIRCVHDPVNDVVMYTQMASPTLYNIDGAHPHTAGQTYTYRPFSPDFSEWGYRPTNIELMGDGVYARSPQVMRTGKNVGLLGYKYNHANRSWVPVEWLLPVDGWELPFSHRGGVYPYTQSTGSVYTVSYIGESVSKSGKPALAVGGNWFELDPITGMPTRLNDPRPAFAAVARVIRINPIYRSKVATDGKGTAAFVAHQTLYVSRNGGEFRPTLNGSIHNVQYAAGVWCLTAVHYSTKAQTADAVITALSVCMSLDLVTFKSYTFWSSSSGETYVDFLWCVGRWFPLTISTLYGPTASSGQKMDTWLTSVTFRAGFITKGDELLQVGQPPVKALPWKGMLHRGYGFVSGVEWSSYQDGEYVNVYMGDDGHTTTWTSDLNALEYSQSTPPTAGNPDMIEYAFVTPSHKSLGYDKRVGQFLTTGPAIMPRGGGINAIAGRGVGRYALLSGATFTAHGWVDWGKHRYVFTRTNLGFTVVVGTQYYRVCKMWIAGNSGNYLSITTGDCGQIFILTARGSLLRGKRGIVATPVQSNNLSNIYMRVL